MKQRERIAMQILNPGACIYASRDEWTLTHVTQPRTSCLEAIHLRNALRSLFPGEQRLIGGVWVTKVDQVHKAIRYRFDGKRQYTFEEAVAYIENPPPEAQPATLMQLPLPLKEAS
jgi:hypothetical protein